MRKTQKQQILEDFIWNKWAGPRRFMRQGIAQYNARLFELREEGWVIESRPVHENGKVWMEHRMVPDQNRIMVAEYMSKMQGKLVI